MMDTFSGLELRDIPVSLPFASKEREEFLRKCGLDVDHADYAVGVYTCDDRLVATASVDGDTVKGVAVDPDFRSESLTPRMVAAILDYAARESLDDLKVFTKPKYEKVFSSLTFKTVARSVGAVLMYRDIRALERYKEYLRSLPRKGRVGCIVMNVNPLTLGHRFLIHRAAAEVDTLFIIPVADNPLTEFSYAERREMLMAVAVELGNVQVVDGSRFVISRDTFPTYFIKEVTDVARTHVELDLDLFVNHIAPCLDVNMRFVGTEPEDRLTAIYNEAMCRILPQKGITVREIDRLTYGDGLPFSASRVRALLDDGCLMRAAGLVPVSSFPAVVAHAASHALQAELDLTPKPGLVDRDNSGAHDDMDHALMSRSIKALTPVFLRLAHAGASCADTPSGLPEISILRRIGIEGEAAMMEATGGVNTHRGALFSMGLAVVAVTSLMTAGKELTPQSILDKIAVLAAGFPRPEGTHGAGVSARDGVPTALDSARMGFPCVLDALKESSPHRMLLRLMSLLHDSNIYHRCGARKAAEVRKLSADILASADDDNLLESIRALDREFIPGRISPGGAADMLALTLFIKSATGC